MSKPFNTPNVRITALLRKSLEENGFDVDYFIKYFAAWKGLGPRAEFSDPYFGKDGEYGKPTRNSKRVLRHVHLPPESDPLQAAAWKAAHARGSRKTSDTALVYAFDHRHGYLLIYIAREPTAHELAGMNTQQTARFMNDLADVADAFIYNGQILI